MNRKMIRDIVILAVIAVVAVLAYQFYSVGNRVKKEAAIPSSPPPPPSREEMPPSAGMEMDGAAIKAHMMAGGANSGFEKEIERAIRESKIERNDGYGEGGAVAIVNGQEIPSAEFERRLRSRASMMGAGSPHAEGMADGSNIRDDLIEKMIREAVIRQEAAKRGVAVSEKEIRDALDERMKRFPSKEEFESVLKAHNFTMKDVRDQIAREMLVEKLRNEMEKGAAASVREPGETE